MIQRLRHTELKIAENIRKVFQESYLIEAKLLGAREFPPLQRKLDAFLTCDNLFYGFFMEDDLAAVIEIVPQKSAVHIQSLVVHPQYFKMGIASGLISFILGSYPVDRFTVETGVKNMPALKLYEKIGFKETKQWDTDHGIRKVSLEKIR